MLWPFFHPLFQIPVNEKKNRYMNWLWKLAAIISKYQLWTLCSFFKKTSIINTSARVSCRQLSPLWSHLLMVITPSVCNYPDSDLLMFKMLFYHATHQGKFFEVHMFSISHGLVHTHTATSHSFTPGHCNQRCTAGRGDSEAVKMHLCGNCWKVTLMCLLTLFFQCITCNACDNAITESADTCLQVPAPAEMNEINTPAPAISPSHRQPQVYIIVDLYSAELIMRHSADLLTWKIGNYGRQSAVLVECRYCKPLTILWNCYSKHRGSTMPQNQCSS